MKLITRREERKHRFAKIRRQRRKIRKSQQSQPRQPPLSSSSVPNVAWITSMTQVFMGNGFSAWNQILVPPGDTSNAWEAISFVIIAVPWENSFASSLNTIISLILLIRIFKLVNCLRFYYKLNCCWSQNKQGTSWNVTRIVLYLFAGIL